MASVEKIAYSVEEAAQALGISRAHAYNLVRSGQLPAKRFGNRWVVSRKALERLLES